MYDAPLTAPRFQTSLAAILLAASWTGLVAAQSAPISGDQWRAAGETQYTAASTPAATASSDDSVWRLPNGQPSTGVSQAVDDTANPLRQTRRPQPMSAAREPRAFDAPAKAAPLNASKSAANGYNKPAGQRRSTAAPSDARLPKVATQAYVSPRALPNRGPANAQNPVGARTGRSAAHGQGVTNSAADDLWQTITVAFQGQPTPKKDGPESLPMPGNNDEGFQDPVMRYPSGPGAFHHSFGGPAFQPYGDPNNCCDNNGCGDCPCGDDVGEPGCGCPCGSPCGENGCACEPGCGCPSDGPCKKEVFCIGPGDDESCHIVQIRWPKWQEVVVFGGVQGFKGPYDRERDSGNFGFNEGFNIGAKVPYAEMGYQYGYRGAQSQLNGDKNTDTEKQFFQQFATAGLFHRSQEGVQFGVVWDALIDERTRSENFHQIRSELSVIHGCNEFGCDATVGINTHKFEDDDDEELIFQASDQYVFFYRLHGRNGGEGRIYAGFNNDSDGIVGSDMQIPVGERFSVQSGFTYLIPNAKPGEEGASQEAWNIGMGLVWHWDGQARKCFENCYRPMFNVADNGLLIVDLQKKKD